MLRRRRWHDWLITRRVPPVLPKVPRSFLKSKQWDDQLYTLKQDYKRICGLGDLDVVRINARYASNMHAVGYTQGYLYLLRSLYMVFGNDEAIVYWSFVRLVDIVRPYGPVGKAMGGPRGIRRILEYADPDFDEEILIDIVSVRWGFILFAQTIVCDDCLLATWDVLLQDTRYIQCVMAAILKTYRYDHPEAMMRLQMTCDVQIKTQEEASTVLSVSRAIHRHWHG
jgi:hypothetical protein